MPCPCTANTLRLFIRNVAQVDIVGSVLTQTPRKQLQITAIRSFTSIRTLHQRHDSKSFPPHRPDTNRSHTLGFPDKPVSFAPNVHLTPEAQRWPQGSARDEAYETSDEGTRGAIAELSLESVDSIAAEGVPEYGSPNSAQGGITSSPERTEDTALPDPPSRTTFRRTKVQNTSLAIHFSAPRASLKAHSTIRSEPGKSNIRLESKIDSISSHSKGKEKSLEEDEWTPPPRENWQIDKAALKEKFPGGWNPQKRLSPDALAGIRALHAQMPERFTTSALATHFQVSPEAIRRILKSKWSPDADEESDRERRWFNRGKKIYTIHAEKGQKPPKKWRELGIGDGRPEWMLRKRARAPLPALITTARRREQRESDSESKSFADSIL